MWKGAICGGKAGGREVLVAQELLQMQGLQQVSKP